VDTVSSKKDGLPSESEVARYLRNHPGFFLNNEDLLTELKITHKTGKAISLLERQVEILRERNIDMRSRISTMLDNAQRNDMLFEQSKALVLALLDARRAEEFSNSLCRHLVSDFKDVDYASLIIFADPNRIGGNALRVVSPEQAQDQIGSLLRSKKAVCGVLRGEELSFLFGKHANHIGSAALMPIQAGSIDGVVAIASKDPQYFTSSMGTIFLEYIADVVNRTLPKLMKGPFL
jgi:uncharacterized protein YigA (DUF484 family)